MNVATTNAGEPLKYVFIEIPRCPSCGSTRLLTLRSVAVDEIRQKSTVCRTCDWRFVVVIE